MREYPLPLLLQLKDQALNNLKVFGVSEGPRNFLREVSEDRAFTTEDAIFKRTLFESVPKGSFSACIPATSMKVAQQYITT